MLHEFSRTELLIGAEALAKLADSRVAVFGIGGVGTFVVEGLARAGVGKFVLVDHDCICMTNINRQIHATVKTIGKPKVEAMRDRILEINPRAEVIIYQKFYSPEASNELIKDDYDYIVDAIDSVTGKIDLIVKAKEKGIPIISSMGAGNKLDPTRFEVADIFSTSVCPLAKVMRKELRKRSITSLKVVYSREEPLKPAESEESGFGAGSASSYVDMGGVLPNDDTGSVLPNDEMGIKNIRRQVPGSISFVPSVAGLIIAGEVVKDLIGNTR